MPKNTVRVLKSRVEISNVSYEKKTTCEFKKRGRSEISVAIREGKKFSMCWLDYDSVAALLEWFGEGPPRTNTTKLSADAGELREQLREFKTSYSQIVSSVNRMGKIMHDQKMNDEVRAKNTLPASRRQKFDF